MIEEPEGQVSLLGDCVSEKSQRSFTCEVSSTRLPKHDPNKDDTERHANKEQGALRRPQLQTKSLRQLRYAERVRHSLPQGKVPPLAI